MKVLVSVVESNLFLDPRGYAVKLMDMDWTSSEYAVSHAVEDDPAERSHASMTDNRAMRLVSK